MPRTPSKAPNRRQQAVAQVDAFFVALDGQDAILEQVLDEELRNFEAVKGKPTIYRAKDKAAKKRLKDVIDRYLPRLTAREAETSLRAGKGDYLVIAEAELRQSLVELRDAIGRENLPRKDYGRLLNESSSNVQRRRLILKSATATLEEEKLRRTREAPSSEMPTKWAANHREVTAFLSAEIKRLEYFIDEVGGTFYAEEALANLQQLKRDFLAGRAAGTHVVNELIRQRQEWDESNFPRLRAADADGYDNPVKQQQIGQGMPDDQITKAKRETTRRKAYVAPKREGKRGMTVYVPHKLADDFKALAAAKQMGAQEYLEQLMQDAVLSHPALVKKGKALPNRPTRYKTRRMELEAENRRLLTLVRKSGPNRT